MLSRKGEGVLRQKFNAFWQILRLAPTNGGTPETAVTHRIADISADKVDLADISSANVGNWDFALIAEQESQPDDHVGALFFSPIAAGCRFRLLLAV